VSLSLRLCSFWSLLVLPDDAFFASLPVFSGEISGDSAVLVPGFACFVVDLVGSYARRASRTRVFCCKKKT